MGRLALPGARERTIIAASPARPMRWGCQWVRPRAFVHSLDAKALAERAAARLAEHMRTSLEAGRAPDGRPLPGVSTSTLERDPNRRGRQMGMRTGELAASFRVGASSGNEERAEVTVEADVDEGRRQFLRQSARAGNDLMSTDGAAAEVIDQATNEAVAEMAPRAA